MEQCEDLQLKTPLQPTSNQFTSQYQPTIYILRHYSPLMDLLATSPKVFLEKSGCFADILGGLGLGTHPKNKFCRLRGHIICQSRGRHNIWTRDVKIDKHS